MNMIAEAGRGAVVMIRETRPTGLSERIKLLAGAARPTDVLRDYGIGAQILLDLGVRDMILLSNRTRTIVGIEGYGLSVVGQRAIDSARVE
jgi:3,4-dihydroxy 2-butanone 4-phosphate synthase/GTP cyclohydrolase II